MRLASAIAFVLATVLGAMPGHAQTRIALVISDAGYENAHVLPNPINDARDIVELKMVIAADQEGTAPLSAARVLKPKDSFKECAQCPEMVVVPAGSFTMGSPDMEALKIRRLPVINKSKRMVGILSLGDVGHSASGDLLSECVKSVSAHHH